MGKTENKKEWAVCYAKVWVMRSQKPTRLMIFAVIESMNYWKTGTEKYYHLVSGRVGTGWGNNEGARYSEKDVFQTRNALLDSLAEK